MRRGLRAGEGSLECPVVVEARVGPWSRAQPQTVASFGSLFTCGVVLINIGKRGTHSDVPWCSHVDVTVRCRCDHLPTPRRVSTLLNTQIPFQHVHGRFVCQKTKSNKFLCIGPALQGIEGANLRRCTPCEHCHRRRYPHNAHRHRATARLLFYFLNHPCDASRPLKPRRSPLSLWQPERGLA